jgi:tRNA (guanine37-N1)-methyltransferase
VIFHVVTIFPEFFEGPFAHGVIARAKEAGKIEIRIHNLREWTHDRHKTVDDRPFGGGEGMLLKTEPLFAAVEAIFPERAQGVLPSRDGDGAVAPQDDRSRKQVILLSAQGRKFDQAAARRLSSIEELLLICGRYEGVDERVAEHLVDEELTIGDYVMSGGELAAAVVIDVIARLIPGVLGNEDSAVFESFEGIGGVLDCPHYTRPADFRGWRVPEVLLSGNHEEIRRWRRQAALEKTARLRPDLAPGGALDSPDTAAQPDFKYDRKN